MTGNLFVHDNKGDIILHIFSADDLNPIPEGVKVLYTNDEINLSEFRVTGINLDTNKPILEKIVIKPTEEEQKLHDLEKQNADLAYQLMMNGGM